MAASLINSWEVLSAEKAETLTSSSGEKNKHFIFNGITVTSTTDITQNIAAKIGIYQTDNNVYAFASTKAETEPSSGNVNIGENNNATLIASGTGTLGTDKKITGIAITLKNDGNVADLKNLGFSGEEIAAINGSTKDDTIYIINDNGNNKGISEKAKLDFSQGGNDTAFFTGKSSVSMILGGG